MMRGRLIGVDSPYAGAAWSRSTVSVCPVALAISIPGPPPMIITVRLAPATVGVHVRAIGKNRASTMGRALGVAERHRTQSHQPREVALLEVLLRRRGGVGVTGEGSRPTDRLIQPRFV